MDRPADWLADKAPVSLHQLNSVFCSNLPGGRGQHFSVQLPQSVCQAREEGLLCSTFHLWAGEQHHTAAEGRQPGSLVQVRSHLISNTLKTLVVDNKCTKFLLGLVQCFSTIISWFHAAHPAIQVSVSPEIDLKTIFAPLRAFSSAVKDFNLKKGASYLTSTHQL